MNLDDMLASWQRVKLRFTARRLDAPCSTEFEYQGKQFGHPSKYGFARFDCEPAEAPTFEMRARWPANLAADYCRQLEDAIRAAIVDTLVAVDTPFVGVAIACTDVEWNDITSSEVSFYRATQGAMTSLRDSQKWSLLKEG
jgi:hypothetical protein